MQSTIELKYADNSKQVADIVRKTIQHMYPKYYPTGAVQFFLNLHCEEHIKKAMTEEQIYLAIAEGKIVGTGSIRKNEICRLFILPQYQKKGYGSGFMDCLEEIVFKNYKTIHIDASFPAEQLYLKRGYKIISYEKIETENGDFLCYHIMEKVEPTIEN